MRVAMFGGLAALLAVLGLYIWSTGFSVPNPAIEMTQRDPIPPPDPGAREPPATPVTSTRPAAVADSPGVAAEPGARPDTVAPGAPATPLSTPVTPGPEPETAQQHPAPVRDPTPTPPAPTPPAPTPPAPAPAASGPTSPPPPAPMDIQQHDVEHLEAAFRPRFRALQEQCEADLNQLADAATAEYRASGRTALAKTLLGAKYLPLGLKLQAACDRHFETLSSSLRTELQMSGLPLTLAETVEQAYQDRVEEMKAILRKRAGL